VSDQNAVSLLTWAQLTNTVMKPMHNVTHSSFNTSQMCSDVCWA